jgi:hypothetical protein
MELNNSYVDLGVTLYSLCPNYKAFVFSGYIIFAMYIL